ncbi:unnamed protein product [Parascedosporium putredinis]|uniref:Uncharacterized protein n=1 Tax=Parascedosporium putredinis TaxID=1442378 RepID=A0A9P1MBN1_9PEZI|nr:unnamed protein product [Parascedosporium putredinis]CAI7996531.1 unnamed protein product [Parascedosporium putredinis]
MSSTLASRALFRAATRRQLSTARTIARSFEAHPYERMSKEKHASGAYGKMAKNAASRLVFSPSTAMYNQAFCKRRRFSLQEKAFLVTTK